MKTIEEVKQFITDFTYKEYQVVIQRNDANIEDDDYTLCVVRLLACYSKTYKMVDDSLFNLIGRHIGKETNDHGDRIDSLRQRKVFMIKQYEGATFDNGITVDNDTMFSCFLGNDCKG